MQEGGIKKKFQGIFFLVMWDGVVGEKG